MSTIVTRLAEALGAEAVLSGTTLAGISAGYPIAQPVRARALVRPRSTAEVAVVLRLCHAARQPVVTYGGLTNLVQATATSPDEIALSLEHMAQVEEVDAVSRTLTAQAGASLRAVQEAAATAGLMVALDFGARDYCTIGGNVATNAGGGRVLRYGMTREQVLGLEAVLADGTILSSLSRVLKNNTGYDLKQLFIGSEGTLGVVTRVVLRLWEPPAAFATALVAVERFEQVVGLLKAAERGLSGGLSSFEVMWQAYYDTIVAALMPGQPPLPHGHAFYVLLESPVADPERDADQLARLLERAAAQGLLAGAQLARSESQRESLWAIRYGSEQIDYRYAPVFTFDVSLPIGAMEAYVGQVRQALAQLPGSSACWVFGHLGDGNLHLMIWVEGAGEPERHAVEAMVYQALRPYGGSISAEHGIGLEKRAYLHLSRSPAEIALMRSLKATLDPHNILNPGKVLPP